MIHLRLDDVPVQKGDFEKQFGPSLTKMEKELHEFQKKYGDGWFDHVYQMYKARTSWFNYTDIESNLIINGYVHNSTKITATKVSII